MARLARTFFLNELVQETQDPAVLRSELLNLILAGRDTTAGLLANTWFVIAKRRDIWAKLRADVDGLGGRPPTYEELNKMKYVRWVLNECRFSLTRFRNHVLRGIYTIVTHRVLEQVTDPLKFDCFLKVDQLK